MDIKTGHFYFIDDSYFVKFHNEKLMRNKERDSSGTHNRPCFYAFRDMKTGLYWLIPISSNITKFKALYESKVKKYGRCETIAFGRVLGYEKAFLIQNMCPITDKYIKSEYLAGLSMRPVRVDLQLEKELISKARKVLALQREGVILLFADVLSMEKTLLAEREEER